MDDGGHVAEAFAQERDGVRHDLTHDQRRKIPGLTGIRGYAAIWVIAHHCTSLGWHRLTGAWPRTEQAPFLISGYLGVDLFFILSGFVLTMAYGQAVSSGAGLRDFVLGRIFRILPVWWLSLIALALMAPLMQGRWQAGGDHSLSTWLLGFLLIQSWMRQAIVWNTPGWSLSAECLAYVAFPLLAIVTARLRRPAVIIGFALVAMLVLAFRYHHRGLSSFNDAGSFGLERCLCEFTVGIALARLHQMRLSGMQEGNIMLIAGLFLLLPPMVNEKFDFLAVVAFSFLVLSASSLSPWAHTVFGNRIAHCLGEISFSIYVLHWLLLELVFRFATGPTWLIVALAMLPLVVVPLAWVTWRWVEVPGQAIGRSIVARLRARDATRAAPAPAVG